VTVANGKIAHAHVISTPDELASRQKRRLSAHLEGHEGRCALMDQGTLNLLCIFILIGAQGQRRSFLIQIAIIPPVIHKIHKSAQAKRTKPREGGAQYIIYMFTLLQSSLYFPNVCSI